MFKITRLPAETPAYADAPRAPAPTAMDIDDDLGEGTSLGGRRTVVTPGEVITSSKEYMRGHGTYVEDEHVVSSVAGTIERVNKLISVKALKSRYVPEVGDLVIGRIVEVGAQRWRVDANARQDAVLMLSSVNLPGGVQRRRVESDALKMREFLAEGDLLVAEVQAFFQDGAMSLHTRSLKYGKLRNGLLLSLPPRLVRRLKSHFYHLPPPCGPAGVDVILGLNGYVWVSLGTSQASREGGEGFDAEGVYRNENDEIDPESRQAITDVANVITTLASHDVPLSDALIAEGYQWLRAANLEPGAPISKEVGDRLVYDLVLADE
ncbi:Exosome complex component rrp4 [Vanrija albida]|uniref:Exosome complex component rrp4 n=1 Tax=Vanrija albida TaxID=181172 RepID=A0ABR3PTB7_9TREE